MGQALQFKTTLKKQQRRKYLYKYTENCYIDVEPLLHTKNNLSFIKYDSNQLYYYFYDIV